MKAFYINLDSGIPRSHKQVVFLCGFFTWYISPSVICSPFTVSYPHAFLGLMFSYSRVFHATIARHGKSEGNKPAWVISCMFLRPEWLCSGNVHSKRVHVFFRSTSQCDRSHTSVRFGHAGRQMYGSAYSRRDVFCICVFLWFAELCKPPGNEVADVSAPMTMLPPPPIPPTTPSVEELIQQSQWNLQQQEQHLLSLRQVHQALLHTTVAFNWSKKYSRIGNIVIDPSRETELSQHLLLEFSGYNHQTRVRP